ncbi:MAG: ABC transporter ATP-binding protein [Pseudomonadota bacterium]
MVKLLEVKNVSASYGRIQALHDTSIEVAEGQVVALLGGNGAGKTTTLNVISGLVRATQGELRFDGKPITGLTSDQIVKLGIVQVPEGREVFREMTVRENLELGAYMRSDTAKIKSDMDAVLVSFPRLKERFAQKAATLSGGEQQMLAMGRSLMARPRLLMLDEPSMGLSPLLVQQIFAIVRQMHRDGLTILLVEQNVKLALAISSYAYILENGEIVLHGTSEKLAADDKVRHAYLGA